MTTETVEHSSSAPEIQTVYAVPQADWFLQRLIDMVNTSELEMGITLNSGGFLVSGQLVGGKKYFEGFADSFSGAMPAGEGAQNVRDSFASFGGIYSNEDGTFKESSSPQFVHLKNARFFHTAGNPIPGNTGVWWRGRLAEVSGFSLGELSSS